MNKNIEISNYIAKVLTGTVFFAFIWSIVGFLDLSDFSAIIMGVCLLLFIIVSIACFFIFKVNPFKSLWNALNNNYYRGGCMISLAAIFLPSLLGDKYLSTISIVGDVIAIATLIIGSVFLILKLFKQE